MGLGRTLVNVAAKARGRQALKYQFEVIPYFAGEIPAGIDRVLFAWERGTKLFVTEAEAVNQNTRAVFWKQYLRQNATVYKEGNHIVPKEFSFKIQSVTKDDKGERKTLGKVKIDLGEFCTGQIDPQPQDVFLQLKPHGKLKVSIKATWLSDASMDPDAMTEVTEMTEMSTTGRSKKKHRHHEEEEYDEQDLTGFDHGAEASTSGRDGGEGGEDDGQGGHRKKKKGKSRRRALPDEIPEGFELPPDPDEIRRLKEEGAMEDELAEEEYRRQLEMAEDAARAEAGTRLHKPSWKDYICCCCGPQHLPVDPQEEDTLLSSKQAQERDNANAPVKKKKKKKKKKAYTDRPEGQAGPNGGQEGGEGEDAGEGERGAGQVQRGGRIVYDEY